MGKSGNPSLNYPGREALFLIESLDIRIYDTDTDYHSPSCCSTRFSLGDISNAGLETNSSGNVTGFWIDLATSSHYIAFNGLLFDRALGNALVDSYGFTNVRTVPSSGQSTAVLIQIEYAR